MTFNSHFQEFIELLEKKKARYLVIGDYAVGMHGFPRYTGDLDIFIAISKENSKCLLNIFEQFGFGDLEITDADFLEEDFVVEIGREPYKIQILTGIDGVKFDECYTNAIKYKIGSLNIPFISCSDLIKNKSASGWAKDIIDVVQLKSLHGEP